MLTFADEVMRMFDNLKPEKDASLITSRELQALSKYKIHVQKPAYDRISVIVETTISSDTYH